MTQYIGLVLPGITLLVSWWLGIKNNRFDVFFRYILLFIIFTEALGSIVQKHTTLSNHWVYNVFTLLIFVLFIRLFYTHTHSAKWKKLMMAFSFLLVLIFLADNLWNQSLFSELQIFTYLSGAVFLIISISGYLYEMIDSDRIIYFYKLRSFWVSLGLLLFYVPFIPILVGSNYQLFDFNVRFILIISLNIIMHICFITSYLWGEKI
ncbi:MAG: hypothetical protein IPM42_16800 [Saprospiraceae bacterium]|nr:hypothetical protein [Saprospiraceae bacterium]